MSVHRVYVDQCNPRLAEEVRKSIKPESTQARFDVIEVDIFDPGAGNRVYVDRADTLIRARLRRAMPGVEVRWIRMPALPSNASHANVKTTGERAIKKALSVAALGERIHTGQKAPEFDASKHVDVAPKEEVEFRRSALDHGFTGQVGMLLDYANGYTIEIPFSEPAIPTLSITFRFDRLQYGLRRFKTASKRAKTIFAVVGFVVGLALGLAL